MADDIDREQREAEAELEAAIKRVYRSCGGDMLPTQWTVLLAVHGADADSDYSTVDLLPQTGMPRHHLLGLLRAATLRAENEPGEEVDDD